MLAVFEFTFGLSEVTIAEFTAAHVGVATTDVCTLLPTDVASLLSRAGRDSDCCRRMQATCR